MTDHIDRAAEETCGHTVVDADGIEEPCGLPVALGGWRYYEGHEHEDMLRRVCADHEQWALSNGIRARDAEVRAATLAGFEVERREVRACGCITSPGSLGACCILDAPGLPDREERRLVGPWEPEP